MNDFENQLKSFLEKNAEPGPADEIMAILCAPESPRKRRRIDRMERRVRTEFGFSDTAQIDWASIDWLALGLMILKIILALLPIILATEKKE